MRQWKLFTNLLASFAIYIGLGFQVIQSNSRQGELLLAPTMLNENNPLGEHYYLNGVELDHNLHDCDYR